MRFGALIVALFLIAGLSCGFKHEVLSVIACPIDNAIAAIIEKEYEPYIQYYEKYRAIWRRDSLFGKSKDSVRAIYGIPEKTIPQSRLSIYPEADEEWIYSLNKGVPRLVFFKNDFCIGAVRESVPYVRFTKNTREDKCIGFVLKFLEQVKLTIFKLDTQLSNQEDLTNLIAKQQIPFNRTTWIGNRHPSTMVCSILPMLKGKTQQEVINLLSNPSFHIKEMVPSIDSDNLQVKSDAKGKSQEYFDYVLDYPEANKDIPRPYIFALLHLEFKNGIVVSSKISREIQ